MDVVVFSQYARRDVTKDLVVGAEGVVGGDDVVIVVIAAFADEEDDDDDDAGGGGGDLVFAFAVSGN